ncbi:hypothetical protein I79_017792 [Cricetulus griseus]|uniref:Uncharacterized protein n=1 Tax=Cricetulus griseus TaxID=10029 RepID=G3I2Z4_CRIGR|nr:hypothetical protein I79_017792 [Cricetulus griseus]
MIMSTSCYSKQVLTETEPMNWHLVIVETHQAGEQLGGQRKQEKHTEDARQENSQRLHRKQEQHIQSAKVMEDCCSQRASRCLVTLNVAAIMRTDLNKATASQG